MRSFSARVRQICWNGPGAAKRVPCLRLFVRLVFAGEHAAAERAPRNDAEAELLARRQNLHLDVARQNAVLRLQADQRLPTFCGDDQTRLDDLRGGPVRHADVAHLALPDEVVQRAQRFFERRRVVVAMHLIQVDVVGIEPPQAVFARFHDVFAAGTGVERSGAER